MKKLIFFLLLFGLANNSFAQFSLNNFLSTNLVKGNPISLMMKKDITKKIVSDSLENVPITLIYVLNKDGSIINQELLSNTKDTKEIQKLFKFLYAQLSKKFDKPINDEREADTKIISWTSGFTSIKLKLSNINTSIYMERLL